MKHDSANPGRWRPNPMVHGSFTTTFFIISSNSNFVQKAQADLIRY